MTERPIQLSSSWLTHLEAEFQLPYMQRLRTFLLSEKQAGKTIYPKGEHIFAGLNAVELETLKVVILGQDPYHGPNQAHGLSFSVPNGVKIPPSLRNIYQELNSDLNITPATHGNLNNWAQQGVLLLNSVLTVEHSLAASHQGKGWEQFTDKIISVINQHCEHVVFLLWGSYAQRKGQSVDQSKHRVLNAPHPSPLSAHRGFLGCKHFSKTNAYLTEHHRMPIDWALP